MTEDCLRELLEKLTGQPIPILSPEAIAEVASAFSAGKSVGYSQFNELLLILGYDRVDRSFFSFICDSSAFQKGGKRRSEISSEEQFKEGVDAFRTLALLLYGNVKFGFKTLSNDKEKIEFWVSGMRTERSDDDFRARHDQLLGLKRIDGQDTFLLGYLSATIIDNALKKNPGDKIALARKDKRPKVVEAGKWNQNVYLTSDYLDVYIATSMREQHEFLFVNEFIERLSSSAHIKDLKLRIFDPTQAYCDNRVDKGLAEALMLKRAKCTIYLAQESDTLGKDSELASTLAQGKPVIAFVPEVDDELCEFVLTTMKSLHPDEAAEELLLRLLRIFQPTAAWEDSGVQKMLLQSKVLSEADLQERVRKAMKAHYDKRASTLTDSHPLGLQTNLNTGVANGVLVARRVETCAHLLKQIILNQMEFIVEDQKTEDRHYVLLREKLTKCVFRVMTGDRLLTNSLWNFYPSR